jgi:sec-independent protein translocase protein TatC
MVEEAELEETEEEELSSEEEALEKKMGFLDHMEELRQRILRSIVAVIICSSIGGIFWRQAWDILVMPAGGSGVHFQAINPLEPFMFKLKLAIFLGTLVAAPFIIYELMAFISPALKSHEKKWAIPFVLFLVVLFYTGVVFGYYIVMPPAMKWLFAQSGGLFEVVPRVDEYLAFAVILTLGIGASFETPMFIVILNKFGIVSRQSLIKNWRIAVVLIVIIASILTPDWSPVTMLLFAAPMIVLYFLSILLVRIF